MKRKLAVFLLALASCLALAFGLAACDLFGGTTDYGESTDGTYYLYESGELDKSQYIKLDGENWSDSDGIGGTFTLNGIAIVFYVEIDGSTEEWCDGTLSDGVLTVDESGEQITYCKEGKTPSENDNPSTPGDDDGDGLSYELRSEGYAVVEYRGSATNVIIPSTYEGLPVTDIEDYAFNYCTELTSITIPENVTSIGNYAFYKCTGLTEINFNATACSDLSSKNYVFYNAGESGVGIKVTIGSNVTKIPAYLFCPYSGYPKLTSVVFAENSQCESIGSYAFYYCTSLTSITIPESVTSIGNHAFYSCTGLTEINFNATSCNDLSSKNYVFYKAGQSGDGITVNIGPNVTAIPAYLFYPYTSSSSYVPKITSVVFADDSQCKSIGGYAFDYCTSLTDIYYSGDVAGWMSISGLENLMGLERGSSSKNLYFNNELATEVTIPESVTSIDYSAFGHCASLSSITIPDSVTSVGAYAFIGCKNLTNVKIGSSVTRIGWFAFQDCASLTSVTIPDSVTSIASGTFYDCTSLASVTIGSGVTSIYNQAFYNCTALTEINFNATACDDLSSNNHAFGYAGQSGDGIKVTIGANVTKIPAYLFYPYSSSSSYAPRITSVEFENNSKCESVGDYAFYDCTALTSVSFEKNSELTDIGNYAFYYCTSLTSITIESGSIGDYAFYYCTSLTSITIESGSIGYYAFNDCANLTSVAIGNSVTSIGSYAFNSCTELASVTFRGENSRLASIGSYAFAGCTNLASITIPSSVTGIGSSAFCGCNGLESITLPFVGASKDGTDNTYFGYIFGASSYSYNSTYVPSSLKTVVVTGGSSIGKCAFNDCANLTSVAIGNSVTSIGSYAFNSCTSLTSITIPESVTSIGGSAFSYCTGLTEINYNANECDTQDTMNFAYAGENGEGITVTIGSNVTKIPDYLFNNFSHNENRALNITSVVFEEGSKCESIGICAFYYCTSLTSITIPGSVTNIGSSAFADCTALASVTFKESSELTNIGNYAFDGCTALTSVYAADIATWCNISFNNASANPLFYAKNLYLNETLVTEIIIPDNVKSIGSYAFYAYTALASVTFEENSQLTSIGSYAFYNCSFESITIPESVTSIGSYAFYYCTSLTSITIGSGSIGDDAFYNCTSLKSVTIGNGVTSIGRDAFYTCTALMTVTFEENSKCKSIEGYAFCNCTSLTSIIIPDSSVTSIGSYAFRNCTALTTVTIGSGVKLIGSYAFEGCTALTSVTFTFPSSYWFVASTRTATSGTSVDVSYPSKNATNLTKTYVSQWWHHW